MDKNKEEPPLLLPTLYPMYPFREDHANFIEGIGDYLLTIEDYTSGSLLNAHLISDNNKIF